MSIPTTSNIDRLIADLDWGSSHPAAAVHRLSIALTRTAGLPDVGRTIVRHVAGALRTGGAALAVPDPAMSFDVVATYGDAQRATAALRAAIHGACESGPTLPVGHRLLIQQITSGDATLGILSVADRLDGQPFTRVDRALLEGLTAPAALALEREMIRAQVDALARAATIDPLSGLFNRRHFHVRMEEEAERARRRHRPMALLMIDLDDFKRVNDTYGHLVGDATIKATAVAIRRSVRYFDVCTRYGGEEFAVLMPDSDGTMASIVAERIRSRIAAWRMTDTPLIGLHITASIGFALSEASIARDALIARADSALYDAKKAGKNRVCGAR